MTDTPDVPPTFIATHEHNLDEIPDPNGHLNMVGEILPHDWTPDDGDA